MFSCVSCVKLLQGLNLMDYSLLIGIHDCTLPSIDSDEEELTEDELDEGLIECLSGEEQPDTPTSLVSGNIQTNKSCEVLNLSLGDDSGEQRLDDIKDLSPDESDGNDKGIIEEESEVTPVTRAITISPVIQEIEGFTSILSLYIILTTFFTQVLHLLYHAQW